MGIDDEIIELDEDTLMEDQTDESGSIYPLEIIKKIYSCSSIFWE